MKNLKEFLKNPYGNMTAFALGVTLIAYIITNIVTLITIGHLFPIVVYVVIFLITLPVGLTFVAIERHYKRKSIEAVEKLINEVDEPYKGQLNTLLEQYKIKWNFK